MWQRCPPDSALIPAEPGFEFGDRNELQPEASNPAQLRRDVLIEEVPAAAKRMWSLNAPASATSDHCTIAAHRSRETCAHAFRSGERPLRAQATRSRRGQSAERSA